MQKKLVLFFVQMNDDILWLNNNKIFHRKFTGCRNVQKLQMA